MDFDVAGAKPVPGDGVFVPTLEWSEQVLQVPVEKFECKQLGGGGAGGVSGASYFNCDAAFGGSAANPTLGLPSNMFIKMRSPTQSVDEFDAENAVAGLAKYLPTPPPLARMLSSDRNYLLMQNIGTPISQGCGNDANGR